MGSRWLFFASGIRLIHFIDSLTWENSQMNGWYNYGLAKEYNLEKSSIMRTSQALIELRAHQTARSLIRAFALMRFNFSN